MEDKLVAVALPKPEFQFGFWICRQIAAKACFYYSMALNTAAQEREDKRMKALREAEALVHREQEKGKHQLIIILVLLKRKQRDMGKKMKFMLKTLTYILWT